MSLARPASVDELLNYRLARLLGAASAPGIRLLEGRYGIRRRAWGLLGLIAAHGAMSPSELAERSHLERAKISLNVTALVKAGLLRRVAMAGDRRRARLELSEQGRQLFDDVFPQLAALSASVLRVLSESQVAALDEIIGLLATAAEALNAASPVAEKADRRHGGGRDRVGAGPRPADGDDAGDRLVTPRRAIR